MSWLFRFIGSLFSSGEFLAGSDEDSLAISPLTAGPNTWEGHANDFSNQDGMFSSIGGNGMFD